MKMAELLLHTVRDPIELPEFEQDDQTAFTVEGTPNTDREEFRESDRDSLPTEEVACLHSVSSALVTASNGTLLPPFSPDDLLDSELAFNPVAVTDSGLLLHAATEQSTPETVGDGVKTVAEEIVSLVAHPKRTIIRHYRSKSARRLSRIARPYFLPGMDRKLLAAHDNLLRVQLDQVQGSIKIKRKNNSRTLHSQKITEKSKKSWINKENNMIGIDEKDRPETQSRKFEKLGVHRAIAWIIERYIKKVRRVPSRIINYPSFGDERFLEKDGSGSVIRFKWERYIGQVCSRKSSMLLMCPALITFFLL